MAEDAAQEVLRKKQAGELDEGTVLYSEDPSPSKKQAVRDASANPAMALLPKQYVKGAQSLLVFVILGLACVVAFASRLFAVIRFESIIHEFDPWFNYRSTHQMVTHGFYEFLNWFDERAWYPLGRIVGGTVYPGLMLTSGLVHYVLNSLHLTIHIRDVCVFLAPMFSGLTAIATFLLTREVWNERAGLFAACFIAIVPGYISRSVAGSYDNEGIAIFALMLTFFLWLKSVKTGSVFWSILASLSYFYMVSAWGGYVFIINLIPLHVFVLLIMGRYSSRIYVAYTTFYILGLIMSMQVPFVGFQPIRTSEHMAAAGVFALLQAYGALRFAQGHLSGRDFKLLFRTASVASAALVFLAVVALTYLGYVAPWSGRFYSLWDTGYAKIHIPIIASVSEHQPTTWTSFFFDLHILVCVFPAGIWIVMRRLTDERVFVVLYAVFASYFAGVMVRLMLTLTPIVCVLAAIVFSRTFDKHLSETGEVPEDFPSPQPAVTSSSESTGAAGIAAAAKKGKKKRKDEKPTPVKKEDKPSSSPSSSSSSSSSTKKPTAAAAAAAAAANANQDLFSGGSIVTTLLMILLAMFAVHSTWVTSNAYSSPSVVLASTNSDGSRNILDDFREAYFWLRQNTDDDARVMSWWDYGYQIAGMANRTTLVDNNTWNNSHIAMVGKAMSSTEDKAYVIMRSLNVNYVLVIFGGMIGYSGDDINKFLWMVRIAEGEHPQDIKEKDYFTPQGEYKVDSSASSVMLNSLMYKLSYYRFGELQTDYSRPAGFDRTRNVEIGNKNVRLTHMEEAFTSEHWLVRIYKVKDLENRIRNSSSLRFVKHKRKHYSKKTPNLKKKGVIKNKVAVKKGPRKSKKVNKTS